MSENNNQTPAEIPIPTTARRPKQYGFQPSSYADKKPVTMRLSKEARELLDAEACNANTSVTELVEQIVRQRVLVLPGGEKLSVVDFPVDKDETQRNLDAARAEIARLQATAQEIKPQTVLTAPANRDIPKPTFQAIKKYWTDKEQGKWELDSYRGKPFNQMIIDTIYEHWILNPDF